jgi:2,4-dienoyl-CoA reductase-like NADH-dependent reductase (Old Yellow Enzyme family)
MAYPIEVVAAVRDAIGPGAILSVRFSQWKEMDYGAQIVSNPDELAVLLTGLENAGANLLHPSCRRFYDPAFPGSELSLAGWCKAVSDLPVITVGSVGLPTDVMSALVGTDSDGLELGDSLSELTKRFDRNEFDLVAVGRSLIADPEWAAKVRNGNLAAIRTFRKEDLGKALEMEPEAIKEFHR